MFDELRLKWGELVGKLTEMVLGTSDAEEAFEKLYAALEVTIAVAEEVITAVAFVVETLWDLTIVGPYVTSAFSLMTSAMVTTREQADLTTAGIGQAAEELANLAEGYASRSAEFQLRAAEDIERQLAQGAARLSLESMGMDTVNIEANIEGLTDVLLGNEESWDLVNRRVGDYGRGLASATGVTVDATTAFHGLGQEGYALQAALGVANEESISARESIEELNTSVVELGTGFSQATTEAEAFSDALGGKDMDAVSEAAQASKLAWLDRLQAEADFLEASRQLKFEARIEERAAREAEDADTIERTRERFSQLTDEQDAHDAKVLASLNAQRGFAESSMQAVSAILAGEEGAKESFMRLIGTKLMAEGSSAIFKGGIMLLDPLTAPAGAGTIAAGIAALGAGQAIVSGQIPGGAAPSAVSQGAAAPAMQEQASVDQSTRVEIQNNFGIATDGRQVARAVSDAMRDAQTYGFAT